MGLIRLAAIAAVGVSLLPADRESQDQVYVRAASAAQWAVTFCDRNAATCTQASSLWSDFSKKAQFGAKLAFDMAMEKSKGLAEQSENAAPASYQPAQPNTGGTLTRHDLAPAWRGKTANKSGI